MTVEGPYCDAKLRNKDRRCKHRPGFRTPHEGEGRCYLHGGLTPVRHGRYSKITHTRVRHLLDELAKQDRNVLDLEPEAQLLRAMIIDFVNRYEDFTTKLDAWYKALDRERSSHQLPPVPRRIPELGDIKELAEGVSRVVERMHRIQREGSITLDTFRLVMQSMGVIVAKHVTDASVLRSIEREWSQIMVDPRSFLRQERDDDDETKQDQ